MSVSLITVTNPVTLSLAAGAQNASGGKQGETLVSEVHGKYYSAAYNGKLFTGSTLVAGTVIPISTTTTATFLLHNPLGSGVNVELISCDILTTTTVLVVSGISLSIVTGLTLAPTTLTALTPLAMPLGGTAAATPQAKLYSAATIAAATTTAIPLFGISSTVGVIPLLHHDFDGKVVLAPGSLCFLSGNAAQTQATVNRFDWIEWLP